VGRSESSSLRSGSRPASGVKKGGGGHVVTVCNDRSGASSARKRAIQAESAMLRETRKEMTRQRQRINSSRSTR